MISNGKRFVINIHALHYVLILFLFLWLLMVAVLQRNGDVTQKFLTHRNLNLIDSVSKFVFKNSTGKTKITEYLKKLHESYYCEVTTIGCLSSITKPTSKSDIVRIKFLSLMTKERCFQQCPSSLLPMYVGLTSGDLCMCTWTIDDPFRLLGKDKCSSKCSGDKTETCGGSNAIEWFSLQVPCIKGELLNESYKNFSFMRCLSDDVRNTLMSSERVIKLRSISASACILHCSSSHYPLAFFDDVSSRCICGKFTKKINLTHVTNNCNRSSMKIYRAYSEDKRCEPLKFLPKNSTVKRLALVSYPGSGNTWIRHMLQQATGIYTGSVYGDDLIRRSGFLGEPKKFRNRKTFIIKDHMLSRDAMSGYDSAILLVRNPYKAHVAEYHRKITANHLDHAISDAFLSKRFEKIVMGKNKLKSWVQLIKYVVESQKSFHFVMYEVLVQNPINEIKKILKFLEEKNGFKLHNLEERLLCLSENIQGKYKRTKNELKVDPFTDKMKEKLNSEILLAEKILADAGKKINLSVYKREK